MSNHDIKGKLTAGRKPNYESPVVVSLGELAKGSGQDDCTAGPTAYRDCTAGTAALRACTAGVSATVGCTAGNALV